jgi:hypothetical protein
MENVKTPSVEHALSVLCPHSLPEVPRVQVPNATNPLCGYKIVTGQPSDRLNEDFTPQYSEFTERLAVLEERTKKQQKALMEAAQKTSKEITEAKEAAAKKELVGHPATGRWSSCLRENHGRMQLLDLAALAWTVTQIGELATLKSF